jgi:hypothetical protein
MRLRGELAVAERRDLATGFESDIVFDGVRTRPRFRAVPERLMLI